jgi:hypothetical protein
VINFRSPTVIRWAVVFLVVKLVLFAVVFVGLHFFAHKQRPIHVNHIDRISCCANVSFERNFDPYGSKRAHGSA